MPDEVSVESDGPTRAKFRVFIRGSAQAVWDEITRTDEPIKAFFGSRMDAPSLAPGSTIAMRTPDGRYTGVVGEILRCEPPRLLEHTFRFTNYDDPPCIVRYEIEPENDGVVFTMTLLDLPEGTKSAKQMLSGGKLICGVLRSVIETGRPATGQRMILRVIRLVQPLTPKRCRSEHWPVHAAEEMSS